MQTTLGCQDIEFIYLRKCAILIQLNTGLLGIYIFPINGACHRVGTDDTAFANRHIKLSAVIAGTWHDAGDDAANIAWVKDYYEALKPWSEVGGYVNFMAVDDQDLLDRNYGAKFQRLQEIKATYDPGNLFRVNQNIAPM